jgi:hypothetical protein
VKPNFKSLFLGCFVLLALFAGSARAQEAQDDAVSNVDPKLQKALDDFKASKSGKGAVPAARSSQQAKSEATSEADTCAYTFTSGTGLTYLQWCATVNGNIVEFQSPQGVEQIRQGGFAEGYGICDLTGGDVAYYDFADGGSSGFGAPVLDTKNATLVKITRTTTDGLWTLIQTLSNSVGTNPAAKVTMQLKNNSSVTKEAFLFRWADVDPGNTSDTDTNFDESFDSTGTAAWGWVPSANDMSSAPSHGMMFQNSGNLTPPSVAYASDGYGLNTSSSPAPCNPSAGYTSPISDTDGAILYLWIPEDIKKNQTVTVNGKYFSF